MSTQIRNCISKQTRRFAGLVSTFTAPVIVSAWVLLFTTIGGVKADDIHPAIVFHPGETIHVMVTVKDGLAFERGSGRFILQGQPRSGQKPFAGVIDAALTKSNPGQHEYEFSATIGENVAAGEFRLAWIEVSAKGFTQTYSQGADFQPLSIRIENEKRVDFPEITGIKVTASSGGTVMRGVTVSGGVVIH